MSEKKHPASASCNDTSVAAHHDLTADGAKVAVHHDLTAPAAPKAKVARAPKATAPKAKVAKAPKATAPKAKVAKAPRSRTRLHFYLPAKAQAPMPATETAHEDKAKAPKPGKD